MRLSVEKMSNRKLNSTMSAFDKLTEKEEQKLKKYESWFFYIKEKRKEVEKMRANHKEKIINANQTRNSLIANSLLKSKQIKQEQEQALRRSSDARLKTFSNFSKSKERFMTTLTHIDSNRSLLHQELENKRNNILSKQFNIISRGTTRESIVKETKKSIVEQSMVTQLELTNDYNLFLRKLNKSKEKSILKLNHDQKKSIYLRLKREERERKKKEEEDKLKAMGLL